MRFGVDRSPEEEKKKEKLINYNYNKKSILTTYFCHSSSKRPAHLAGPAVPVGGGTGQEMGASGRAPTPTAGAAATAGCPVQSRVNGQIRERIRFY